MISFYLRLILTFPYKGAFFVRLKHRTGFMYRTTTTTTTDDGALIYYKLTSCACPHDRLIDASHSSNKSFIIHIETPVRLYQNGRICIFYSIIILLISFRLVEVFDLDYPQLKLSINSSA